MIWRQDNDPFPERETWEPNANPSGYGLMPSMWPTCDELRNWTAHELADTVVQILCGQGITYGLGVASASERQPERFQLCGTAYFTANNLFDLERARRVWRKVGMV